MSTHEQTTTDSTIENPVAEAPGIHDALAEGQSSAIDNITSQTPWWVVSTTLHALLIALLATGVRRAYVTLPSIAGTDAPSTIVFSVLGIAATFGIAWISWRLFEQPVLRLKRFF